MIREGYEASDIQLNFLNLFKQLTTTGTPWNRWEVIESFPDETVFSLEIPIIYIEAPIFIGDGVLAQGADFRSAWSIILGAWVENDDGGALEVANICSQVVRYLQHPNLINEITYDIDYYGTSYTATTLYEQVIAIERVAMDRWVAQGATEVSEKSFRREITFEVVVFK